jgi:hypothetical protein
MNIPALLVEHGPLEHNLQPLEKQKQTSISLYNLPQETPKKMIAKTSYPVLKCCPVSPFVFLDRCIQEQFL